jgi:hypothetical protein
VSAFNIVERTVEDLLRSWEQRLRDAGAKDGDDIPEVLVPVYKSKGFLSGSDGEMTLERFDEHRRYQPAVRDN